MTPYVFIGGYGILSLLFRLSRLIVVVRQAHASGRGSTTAKPMFWVMTIGFLIYMAIGAAEGWQKANSFHWGISALGVTLYGVALLLREKAIRDLGRFFSPDIEIRQRHHVIRKGLYRYVRHPLLLCMLIEVLAVGLTFNAFRTLLILGAGIYVPLLMLRWHLEERALVRSLGESYRHYQREVGAFWPRISHG